MRYAVLGGEAVKKLLALDAKARLQAPGGIVEAGMNDLTRARADLGPDLPMTLENEHLMTFEREGARNRKADHTSSDDRRLYVRCHAQIGFVLPKAPETAGLPLRPLSAPTLRPQ